MSPIFTAIAIALLHRTPPPSDPLWARASIAETAAVEAARAESSVTWERDARIAFVFAYLEAGWSASPKGSSDRGEACGSMQVHARQWASLLPVAWTCAVIRSDLVIGMRAGLLVMHHLEGHCGSLARAVGAYATGACNADLRVVRDRCVLAGLTPKCEAKP